MNTKVLAAVVAAVIIAGGAWLFLGKESAQAPTLDESPEAQDATETTRDGVEETDTALSGRGSFLDLMGMGRSLMCDFSYESPDTDGVVAGTVKISGEDLRGDFEMMQAGEVYESHMIQDDTHMYTWMTSAEGSFAMKMPLDAAGADADVETSDAYESSRPIDMGNEVEYDCRPWSVDRSVFVPPSNIEFQDMGAMMESMMQGAHMNGFDPTTLPQ